MRGPPREGRERAVGPLLAASTSGVRGRVPPPPPQGSERAEDGLRDVWDEHDVVLDDGIGEPLSPWTVSADFRRVVAELGLRGRGSTTCDTPTRRSCFRGVHVKAVSERLGHSARRFTMDTYSAVIPSMGRAAADAADQLFG